MNYFRQPKHDRGSVEGEVQAYLTKKKLVRGGEIGVKDPKASGKVSPRNAGGLTGLAKAGGGKR